MTRAVTSSGTRGRTCRPAGAGRDDVSYIGRTSLVTEYIGSELTRVAIQFVEPAVLGHAGVAITARVGSPDVPVDIGWLVHQIRPTGRMWHCGPESRLRTG